MNQVILDPTAPAVAAPGDASATAVKSGADQPGAELFRTTLATTIADAPNPVTAPKPAATATDSPQPALTATITKMMNAGASQADIVSFLAKGLAATTARTLQTPAVDARGKLQALFSTALAPPGAGAGGTGSVNDRAAALAKQCIQLAAAAESIASQQLGQQKPIAGTISDAPVAKDIPARTTTNAKPAAKRTASANAPAPLVTGSTGMAASQLALATALLAGTASAPGTLSTGGGTPANAPSATNSGNAGQSSATAAQSPVTGAPTTKGAANSTSGNAIAANSAADASSLALGAVAALPLPAIAFDSGKAVADSARGKRSAKIGSSGDATAPVSAKNAKPFAAGATIRAAADLLPVAGAAAGPPAPKSDSASDARNGPSSSSAALTSAGVAGDGRTVDLGALAATQSGGDTGLGRTLTRAAVAADARQAAADASATPSTTDAAAAPAATATAPAPDVAPNTTVTAFVKAFEAKLKAGLPADAATAQHDPQSLAALPLPAHGAGDSTPAFAPSVAPFTIDRASQTAAAAPAAPAVPIDHSAIADQVLRGAFMRNVGQSSEMRLTLVPDSLGDVSVKLVVDAGNVSAHVVAQTSDVRDALVAAQPQLVKSLADSGLKLTSFTVDLQDSGFAGFSQSRDQSQYGDGSRRSANSPDVDDSGDTLLDAIPSFAPASLNGSGAGYYNYLA